MLDAHELPKRK